jgi:hypothetical protein
VIGHRGVEAAEIGTPSGEIDGVGILRTYLAHDRRECVADAVLSGGVLEITGRHPEATARRRILERPVEQGVVYVVHIPVPDDHDLIVRFLLPLLLLVLSQG